MEYPKCAWCGFSHDPAKTLPWWYCGKAQDEDKGIFLLWLDGVAVGRIIADYRELPVLLESGVEMTRDN